jgi:eukaryotic-like serine/threonine-protein kinase
MSSEPVGKDGDDREARLDAVTDAYTEAQRAGEEPDVREWLARYPDLAPELEQFIEGKDLVDFLASAVPVELRRGSRLGDYRIERLIGRGGMGVVYEAAGPAGLRIALKILPTCALTDPRDRERFRREAEIVAALDHPNIISLLDFGEHAGIPFVAMPWIDGPNLRAVLRQLRHADKAGPLSLRVALPESPAEFAPLTSDQPRWRAVALIGLQAARALEHAHIRGVLHRDIKPSNLLLGPDGVVHVADFGLARSDEHPDLTETGDMVGTLRYMAPERFDRFCDRRSDLYSLGLTLYELLTLRTAFDAPDRVLLLKAIIEDAPRRPRSLVGNIPRDLETIVLKLIEKEALHRYASAADLAADFKRYLDDRPIAARRLHPARRVWSWAGRHRFRAIVLVVALLLPFVAAAAWVAYERMRAETAKARAAVAQTERDAAQRAEQEARFQSLLIQIQQARSGHRNHGWRKLAWGSINEANTLRPGRPDLRDQTVATLSGLDAVLLLWNATTGASSLAFDSTGAKLLLGGLDPKDGQDPRSKLLDLITGEIQTLEGAGPGLVAFSAEERRLQLSLVGPRALRLRNLARGTDQARFDIPDPKTPSTSAPEAVKTLVTALAANGTRVVAAGEEAVHVWDGATGDLVVSLPGKFGALVFSPDASLLAAGDDAGHVRVWSMPGAVPMAEFRQGHAPIKCLAITRDPHRSPDGSQGWLLAARDSGSGLVIYDLTDKTTKTGLRGKEDDVESLAFSPDGTVLAEVGIHTTLWDVALGRPILRLATGTQQNALAFSPDGRQVALATRNGFGQQPGQVFVWKLEPGRGTTTLRGLDSPVSRVAFARDGSVVAALSHGWKAAAWDLPSGRLRLVVDAPLGFSSDNAAIALSPDGKLLALSAGREAHLWDLSSRRRIRTWDLPPGLADQLGFPSPDRLLSFRAEPPTGTPPPRVGLIRDLLGPAPLTPLGRTPPFSPRVLTAAASPDGRFFAVEGFHEVPSGPRRWCRVYDGATGKELWSRPNEMPADFGQMTIDAAGRVLAVVIDSYYRPEFYELATGRQREVWSAMPACLGPGATLRVVLESVSSNDFLRMPTLRRDREEILARFLSDEGVTLSSPVFSPDGRFLAYGHTDGAVTVCDLEQIRRRLGSIGLGW